MGRNPTPRLTMDHLLEMRVVSDAQVDAGGTSVAFVVAAGALEYKQPTAESRLWLAAVGGGDAPRAITAGPGADDLPRWSPDGRMLAFRSDRAERGTGQLYLLRDRSAEAEPLPTLPGGITAIHWAPDGRQIAVIAPDRPRPADEQADHILYESPEADAFSRVWLVDVAHGTSRCLTQQALHIWEIAWAPDGRSIAAIISGRAHPWDWYRARLALIDVASGADRTLYAPQRQITCPAWSPDGRAVALITSTWSDPGMTGGDVVLVPVDGGEPRNLTRAQPRSHLSLAWLPDGSGLVTAALERNRAAICEVGLDGETETRWSDERAFACLDFSMSADGRTLATTLSSPAEPAELWVGRAAGDALAWEQRSAINTDLAAELPLRPAETLQWAAADGTPIEGLLVRPAERAADGPLPLVVMIHGGPTISWPYGLRPNGSGAWTQLLAARGCAVLLPNPRGSAGWGLAFAEANHGDLGGQDLADILAGVDHCVAAGIADPERLGVGGWSYGGYLTAWAITQTDRFKAAVAGASITNWYSFHGGTNIPGFDETFFGTDPYALAGPYAERSPIFLVDRVTTPTLFLHGQLDPCCPIGQATEMTRGLRAHGVETECVIYPREGHGIRERTHMRDLGERAVGWFVDRLID